MKILLLTQWFDPEPTFKGLAFARALREKGHEVEVITGFPNYPGGKIYTGYKMSWRKKEVIDGICVHRVPLYPSHDGSGIRRALNYISFAASSTIFGIFCSKKADIIYAYHPPLTVGMAATFIAFFRRTKLVYDIQDLWPDTLQATGMLNNKKALSFISLVCSWVYRRATSLVVLSPGFKRLLMERGVPEEKISIIYNWCDAEALSLKNGKIPDVMADRFNVVFAGTMGKAQALEKVLAAASAVQKIDKKIQFVFVGGGVEVETLKEMVSRECLQNVIFLPRMPMSEVGAILQRADVLLVHLRDDPLFSVTVPSKTQAYMAVGKPILMAVRGDAADLVEKARCGIVVEPENSAQLAEGVLMMSRASRMELQEMGKRGAEYYHENLSIDVGVEKFINIFQKVSKTSN